MDGLINILKIASEPKGLIDEVQFRQPDLNKPRVDEAANLVIVSLIWEGFYNQKPNVVLGLKKIQFQFPMNSNSVALIFIIISPNSNQ